MSLGSEVQANAIVVPTGLSTSSVPSDPNITRQEVDLVSIILGLQLI